MLKFYQSLPDINTNLVKIPAYFESMKLFTGVRIIPSADFLNGFPFQFHSYFNSTGFPCYFAPLRIGNKCKGFVLKGIEKPTPSFSTVDGLLLGMEKIKDGDVVVLAEGIKDVYLINKANFPDLHGIPMLTGIPSTQTLEILASKKCRIIFVPDADKERDSHINRFKQIVSSLGVWIEYSIFHLKTDLPKLDLGGCFDGEEQKRQTFLNFKELINIYRAWNIRKEKLQEK